MPSWGKVSAVVLVFLMSAASFSLLVSTVPERASAYASHSPILIDGNAGFTAANGVTRGSGTESDPYIIEGWDINASTANGIEIRNTDVHLIVRACYVHDAGWYYSGIALNSCRNSSLSNNYCSNNYCGISLGGISSGDSLSYNNCSNNGVGIILASSNCTVSWNLMYDNGAAGVWAKWTSVGNRIHDNQLVGNNGSGSVYDPDLIQAWDEGLNNWWNDTDGHGNYWGDWLGPDADMNGIVDLPYNISGGAKDYFPLTTPREPIPEFGVMPIVVMVLLAAIFLTTVARRRKAQ
jgi:parallel beta-helix repeat protein